MSEMVERVARAMNGSACDLRENDWDERSDSWKDTLRKHARAAIEAMKEPTEVQYDAISNCGLMWRENNSGNVYKLMIDAALKE